MKKRRKKPTRNMKMLFIKDNKNNIQHLTHYIGTIMIVTLEFSSSTLFYFV